MSFNSKFSAIFEELNKKKRKKGIEHKTKSARREIAFRNMFSNVQLQLILLLCFDLNLLHQQFEMEFSTAKSTFLAVISFKCQFLF